VVLGALLEAQRELDQHVLAERRRDRVQAAR
jgi:hypothetical protein